MKSNKILYSVFDLVEDKEILTRVTGNEVAEVLNTTNKFVYKYAEIGTNFKRRYRITRHEEIVDNTPGWEKDFHFQWEQICNFLNPRRKVVKKDGNEQKENSRVQQC